ncbi:hypothetical protein L6654_38335 [Bradyrhizobium sp. WYCCWR 13023]|uniref:Uncharacterized protein n=1 Tax=Bradyrhizobium zhengyangense TaxID=2911009 RepID=A0A9X1RJS0_9BRAD|nr:hypothetical protein [Bradyrhizobium zhengyangense]MCG2632468.1 hypothetical protein [Bradyrhizobium zhengyangense]MCG2672955.1 hypothetical protein [Bradyrhizobium zhengyangense]
MLQWQAELYVDRAAELALDEISQSVCDVAVFPIDMALELARWGKAQAAPQVSVLGSAAANRPVRKRKGRSSELPRPAPCQKIRVKTI